MAKRKVIIEWYRPSDWNITISVDDLKSTQRIYFAKGPWEPIRNMIAALGQLSPSERTELYGNDWVKYLNDNFTFAFSAKQKALFSRMTAGYKKQYKPLFSILNQFEVEPVNGIN